MKLFECGIRYDKTLENGMQKKVTISAYGCEDVVIDKTRGHEKQDDA